MQSDPLTGACSCRPQQVWYISSMKFLGVYFPALWNGTCTSTSSLGKCLNVFSFFATFAGLVVLLNIFFAAMLPWCARSSYMLFLAGVMLQTIFSKSCYALSGKLFVLLVCLFPLLLLFWWLLIVCVKIFFVNFYWTLYCELRTSSFAIFIQQSAKACWPTYATSIPAFCENQTV